ncbi:MAG: hypothetical protein KAI64_02960 [Thermoplasmata archaeon]|nr:hypothetical protein [Thermoplasmata archaeon]
MDNKAGKIAAMIICVALAATTFSSIVPTNMNTPTISFVADDSVLIENERTSSGIEREFETMDMGDKIVYFHQRTIDGAIVEKDYIVFQLDRETRAVLDRKTHWRDNLPEHFPAMTVAREQAESMVEGVVQFSELYVISPESDVFPLEQTPENPTWIVRSLDEGVLTVTIIDAVDGGILGYGIPPPFTAFSLTGPWYSNPCSGNWHSWYTSAETWYNTMGYETEAIKWPTEDMVKSHIQSNTTTMFYELAHGGSTSFASGCIGGDTYETTYASEIESWIADYDKMSFTFLGSCGGMCNTGDNSLSYEFRKGSTEDTATVGYCGMATVECGPCWPISVLWQDALFELMSLGWTVKDAFDQANADFPACEPCMRFAGDEDFAVVPTLNGRNCIGSLEVTRENIIDLTAETDERGALGELNKALVEVDMAIAKVLKDGCKSSFDHLRKAAFYLEKLDRIGEADTAHITDILVFAVSRDTENKLMEAKFYEGTNPVADREIEETEWELSRAAEELNRGKSSEAIGCYKKAWEHAKRAIRYATE